MNADAPTPKALYSDATAYLSIFGNADTEDDRAFYRELTSTAGIAPERVLDLGSGPSALATHIATRLGVAFDLSLPLLQHAQLQGSTAVRGDITAPMPFTSKSFNACVSHLFGIAYALGTFWETENTDGDVLQAITGIVNTLSQNGKIAWDLPVAYQPRKLVGLTETMPLPGDLLYVFYYMNMLKTTHAGNILDTIIRIECPKTNTVLYELSAPLFVFTPTGLTQLLETCGLTQIRFLPLGELAETTSMPPEDCLRAIVTATRK